MMLKRNKVTDAITAKYSFEAGVIDMFKNLFKTKEKKDKKFELEEHSQLEDKFKDLVDDTFLKPNWIDKNCKELVELDNHKFPFLSMVETSEEFVKSKDLVAAVENYNKKYRELYSNYLSVLKWGHDVFEKVNAELLEVNRGDKTFKEGRTLESDLSDEVHEECTKIIEKAIEKYKPESEKKEKTLIAENVKFSKYLEVKKSKGELVGKSVSYKIELEEMIAFLKEFKSMTIDEEESLFDENPLPPYHQERCTLFIFELARVEFSDYIFSSHAWQGYYTPGYPDKYFNIKTLVDVLKEFID